MDNQTNGPTGVAGQVPSLSGKMTIGDIEIDIATLSDDAKRQIQALRFAETEIASLRMKLTLVEAGKQAILRALQNEVAKTHPAVRQGPLA